MYHRVLFRLPVEDFFRLPNSGYVTRLAYIDILMDLDKLEKRIKKKQTRKQ